MRLTVEQIIGHQSTRVFNLGFLEIRTADRKGVLRWVATLRRILNERVEIRENNRLRKMSKFKAMHYTLVHKALKGDPKALKTMTGDGRR